MTPRIDSIALDNELDREAGALARVYLPAEQAELVALASLPYLRPAEAARLARVSPGAIRRAMYSGDLVVSVPRGMADPRISRRDLDEWMRGKRERRRT